MFETIYNLIKNLIKKIYYYSKCVYIGVFILLTIYFSINFDLKTFCKEANRMIFSQSKFAFHDQEKLKFIENENKNGKGVIFMMNHTCAIFDGTLLRELFDFYTVAKSDILLDVLNTNQTLMSYRDFFYERCNWIPYKRGDKDSGTVVKELIKEYINKGKNVLVFPEGECQRCFKKLKPFRKGIFKLAYEEKIPIFTFSTNFSEDVGFDRHEPVDFIKILSSKPDIDIYANGIFYPQFYSSEENLINDVYYSIQNRLTIKE